ncbi:hypothetical protein VYU27_009468 [Nannochloropsis oceanica]
MSNHVSPQSKKEEFRQYLEKSGVIEALTKVLVGLYEEPERPSNAVDYIKKYMGAPSNVDVEALKSVCQDLRLQVEELTRQNQELKKEMASSTATGTALGSG